MANLMGWKKHPTIVVTGKILKHVNIIAVNNEILLSSETYFSRANCLRAAKMLSRELKLPVEEE